MKEPGHSEVNIHAGVRDSEKQKLPHEDVDSSNSDHHLSRDSSHDRAPLSREPSLAQTKSRQQNVLSRTLSRLKTHKITTDPGPAPDGGFQAWLQCFCAWLALANTWGFALSFGAFQTYYQDILPESASTISWIGSVQACLIFFVGAFSGRALDAGLFTPTVALGITIQLVGIFSMSVSSRFWQLLITQGILTGLGGGLFFCPVMGLMSTYFVKKRGMALGIVTTGNAAGGVIYPVIVRQLLPKIGFGWTVRVLGLLNLVTLAMVILVMRPRLPPRKSGPIFEVSAIRDMPYVLFVVGMCAIMAASYFVFYYIAAYARGILGMSYTDSLNLIIIINGVAVPSRVLPGFIADRYTGALNIFIPIIAINGLMVFAWLGVHSIPGLYAFTVVFGMVAGAFQSLFPTCIGSLSADLTKSGTRLGMAFSVLSVSALVGGPIGGAILRADEGDYTGPIIWAGVSTVIGIGCVVAARVVSKGWSLKIKC